MAKQAKQSAQLSAKEKARRDHERAIEKLTGKSRAYLAKTDAAASPVNSLPDYKAGRRGAALGNHIPAGDGFAKDMLHAYKWKQGKEERTETILEMEERRKRVRYSFRKEGKMYGFDPFKKKQDK